MPHYLKLAHNQFADFFVMPSTDVLYSQMIHNLVIVNWIFVTNDLNICIVNTSFTPSKQESRKPTGRFHIIHLIHQNVSKTIHFFAFR